VGDCVTAAEPNAERLPRLRQRHRYRLHAAARGKRGAGERLFAGAVVNQRISGEGFELAPLGGFARVTGNRRVDVRALAHGRNHCAVEHGFREFGQRRPDGRSAVGRRLCSEIAQYRDLLVALRQIRDQRARELHGLREIGRAIGDRRFG
jgi:hypothetical protein